MKKEYERTPIILNGNAVAVIHIFQRPDKLEDLWVYDYIDDYYYKNDVNHSQKYKDAAKQFIQQLEGQACFSFNKELILQLLKNIKEEDTEYDTNFFEDIINEIKKI